MAHPDAHTRLVGRDLELAALDTFVHTAEATGSTLLLIGEPGVGKSALLASAAEMASADGTRVVHGIGVEYETDGSFAGLHQLVGPLSEDLRELPVATRTTIEVALGIGSGPAPDRLAVMNAALELFRCAAARTPLLVFIDDMHWLDRSTGSVIGFVGRRLGGCRMGLLGATRPRAGGYFERAGLPELDVGPLTEPDAMTLLTHQFAHLPTRVLREVAHEAQGNPLALLEFATAAGGPQGAHPQASSAASATGREVRSLYEARVGRLPEDTRRLLLLAALEGSGSLAALATANAPYGLEALAPAESDHLVLVDDRAAQLRFRHPMVKSVVVEQSTHEERRFAHQRLAEQLADQPERRGHHLAQAADAPDEDTATAVEAGAHHTLQRGDVVGAVTSLLRAADLSPHRADRSRRLADAAYVGAHSAGQLGRASRLLRDASREDPTLAETLHAAVATTYLLLNSDGNAETTHNLLTVAIESALAESAQDRDGLAEALYTLVLVCHYSGRPDCWTSFHQAVARHSLAAPTDVLLLAETFADPLTASPWALAELDDAVDRLQDTFDVDIIIRTAIAAFYTDRLPGCRAAVKRVVRDGRDGGAVGSAMRALLIAAFDDLNTGDWDAAEQAATEATALCREHGHRLYEWTGRYGLALTAANRGDQEVRRICAAMSEWAAPRQLGRLDHWAHHALARAALGAGDFEGGYAHAAAISPPGILASHNPQALWAALDLVDAAVHSGRTDQARAHAEVLRIADVGRLSHRFAIISEAAAAMVASDDETLALFDRALDLPGIENWPFELARVRLAHGERLRRLRHTREARTQLAVARDGFDRLGAQPWSRRASTELQATGATRQTGGEGAEGMLTPQELEVAKMAASGLTNREIAERLYVSPRTVATHLYRTFPKLGISSRAALRDALNATMSDARR